MPYFFLGWKGGSLIFYVLYNRALPEKNLFCFFVVALVFFVVEVFLLLFGGGLWGFCLFGFFPYVLLNFLVLQQIEHSIIAQ